MEIGAIRNTILSNLNSAGTAISHAATWAGREITNGFNDFVVPAISQIWKGLRFVFKHGVSFLRTGHGLGSIAITAGIGLMLAAEHPKLAAADKDWQRLALRVTAAGCFVISGALLVYGSAPLI